MNRQVKQLSVINSSIFTLVLEPRDKEEMCSESSTIRENQNSSKQAQEKQNQGLLSSSKQKVDLKMKNRIKT